jgi:hypothetical protein
MEVAQPKTRPRAINATDILILFSAGDRRCIGVKREEMNPRCPGPEKQVILKKFPFWPKWPRADTVFLEVHQLREAAPGAGARAFSRLGREDLKRMGFRGRVRTPSQEL